MEKNKILIEIYIPSIEKEYDIFIPISKRLGTIKKLLENGIIELTNHDYIKLEDTNLYNKETGALYDVNMRVIDTDLKNGSRLILI